MSDLMNGSSTWATGTSDTASTLQNLIDEKRAQHINGPAAFCVALQGKLGTAASLIGSTADLATRLAVGIAADGTITSAESGDIIMSGRAAKTGWLLCDGAPVSRSTYSVLFTAISTTYGPGDGTTTFNVPDMRCRFPLGTGAGVGDATAGTGAPAGTALPTIVRGGYDGRTDAVLPAHVHTVTDPTHAHFEVAVSGAANHTGPGVNTGTTDVQESITTALAGTGISIDSAGVSATNKNFPPYMGVNFFIKT